MPIDVDKVVGMELPPLTFEYEPKDVILYALGVGAGEEPEDLKYIYENGLEVLPTFGAIPSFFAVLSLFQVEGIDINPVMILHGEQYLQIRKHPLPVEGKFITRPKIANVFDKGKGALLELETETVDENGDVVFFNVAGEFIRGEGGFGGEKGPSAANHPPDRAPDKVVEMSTLPQQAAIYRLSGDGNPLHIDPSIASMAGYEKPILHGLCTFGYSGRAILSEFCDNDPARFKSIKVRFSSHVFPGETIQTEMWDEGEGEIIFQARTAERGEVAISNAVARVET